MTSKSETFYCGYCGGSGEVCLMVKPPKRKTCPVCSGRRVLISSARAVSSRKPPYKTNHELRRHERMDRVNMIRTAVADFILNYLDENVLRDDEQALAEEIHDKMFELYQLLAQRLLSEDE